MSDVDKGFGGFVIGRWLWENNDAKMTASKKNFSYYPRVSGGKPPYWFKTRKEAEQHFKKLKEKNEFPANQENVRIFQLTKKTYLDRY